MSDILKQLTGGDRRSIGRVDEVVKEVLADPSLFEAVLVGMLHDDPLIRMRCADAVEKITVSHPEYLWPYKTRLIRQVAKIDQQKVRWHMAQLFSRLELTPKERRAVVAILSDYLKDESKIVKTFSISPGGHCRTRRRPARADHPPVGRIDSHGQPGHAKPGAQVAGKVKTSEVLKTWEVSIAVQPQSPPEF